MSEWWTDEDHAATVSALLDAWAKRGGSPHVDATALLAALAPTVGRLLRDRDIADRIGSNRRQVRRDRDRFGLPSNIPANHHHARRTA